MNKAILLLVLTCIPIAGAQESNQKKDITDTGNEFVRTCEPIFVASSSGAVRDHSDYYDSAFCLAYVIGVNDGAHLFLDIAPPAAKYCMPSGVTRGQEVRVLIKYIKDHPEKAHLSTDFLEVLAFHDAFPCAAGTSGKAKR
jgi:hypothetical protein